MKQASVRRGVLMKVGALAFTTVIASGCGEGGMGMPSPLDAGPDSGRETDDDADDPTPGVVQCLDRSCSLDKEACCIDLDNPDNSSCVEWNAIDRCDGIKACDGHEDCSPGRICCAKGMNFTDHLCVSFDQCRGGTGSRGGSPLCRSGFDCPPDRPNCCRFELPNQTLQVCSALPC